MKKMAIDTTSPCTICGKEFAEHMTRGFKHQYSPPGNPSSLFARTDQARDASSSESPASQGRVRIPAAGDPVLRMALIRKGLITVEDLETVEAELRATGVAGYEPPQTLG